jgi:hypothetical protein
VPEKRIDWSHCCDIFELKGVPEAKDWLPVIEKLGHRVPTGSPLEFMDWLCKTHNGHPADIVKFILTFPRI